MTADRCADLGWAQRYHWLRYLSAPPGTRHEAHISDNVPVPDGLTVADIQVAFNHMVRRHEVLRTVFRTRPDGRPEQHVQPPAPLPVTVVATDGGPDEGGPGAAAIRDLAGRDFDLEREWPVRVGVVTTGGNPRRLQVVFNHLAFDDVSLGLLRDELHRVLAARAAGRPVDLPPVAHQPVDLARREAATPRRAVRTALEHWQQELEAVPTDVFTARRQRTGDETVPAALSASLTSPTLLAASRELARAAGVWPSAVHLAAYAVVSAAYTGLDRSAHRIYTSQRDASGCPDVLSCLSYPTLVSIDLSDDPPFREVLRRAGARVDQSRTQAHVPYDEIVEMTAREGLRRGEELRIASELNYLTNAPRSCGARRERYTAHPAPADWARAGSDVYFRIYEWADGISLVLQALTEVLRGDDAERWLRGYAALLDLHRDPSVDLRFSEAAARLGFSCVEPPSQRPGRTGPARPDPDAMALIALAEAVAGSGGPGRPDLERCYVAAGGRALRIPGVLGRLRTAGWTGITADDLAGSRTLAELAADLVSVRDSVPAGVGS